MHYKGGVMVHVYIGDLVFSRFESESLTESNLGYSLRLSGILAFGILAGIVPLFFCESIECPGIVFS